MSKITPIHKKGDKNNIKNYRPISNLCSMSKIFEKLIMQRIIEIEDSNNVVNGSYESYKVKCKQLLL